MDQLSLFDIAEVSEKLDNTKRLQVVKSQFIETQEVSWQELFDGFDEIYAITYSSGIQFTTQLLKKFDYAEIIFGCENLVSDTVATIMAMQQALVEKISKNKAADFICKQMEEDKLRLYVSREVMSHEKIFCLRAYDGRTRVVTGSANMSASAFGGIQRENIIYYDGENAYSWYKEQFNAFKESCSDNVNHQVLRHTLADDEYFDTHPEEIPIVNTIERKKTIIIEPVEKDYDDVELITTIKGLEAEIKPMLPKPKKVEGKVLLKTEDIQKFKRAHHDYTVEKKEKKKALPKLHIDYDLQKLTFNGKECNLEAQPENISKDLDFLLGYLNSLSDFYGDVEQAKKEYFAYMNWYFSSLFMPYLRYAAYKHSYESTLFPVVGVIYGDSNGGKSTFLKILSKMMSNAKIPLVPSSDFTSTNIEALKRSCEGIPLNIDDLDKNQFKSHAGKIIKDDEWGIQDHFINYPSIAITTNNLPSLEAPISKRAIGCRINAKIDKEAGIKNSKRINDGIRNISNNFYCEYVRRMLPKIFELEEGMKEGTDDFLPDIFETSSKVLLEIINEYSTIGIPSYCHTLTYSDYFGEKVVGRNAISKIINAWENERKQFTVDKKKNKLIYSYPDGANTYELRYICDELPPKLNAKVASRSLVMDLDAATDFFNIRFKKGMF